jgi:predicted aspartyl protease
MTGHVDDYGRALVGITVQDLQGKRHATWDAWIDTGFNSALYLTLDQVAALGLVQSGSVPGVVGDGSRVQFQTYSCQVEWFGTLRPVEAVVGGGRFALIGIGLLEDLIVTVDYPARIVQLPESAGPLAAP